MAVKKKKPRRHYSEDFIAACLAVLKANRGKLDKTAREMKVPRATLQGWATSTNRQIGPAKIMAAEVNMVEELKQLVAKVCRLDLAAVPVAELNLRDAFGGMAVAVDKILALQAVGNPSRGGAAGKYDLSKLSPEQLRQLADIGDTAAGRPVIEDASDLSNPVLVPWAEPDEPETAERDPEQEQTA